MLVSLGLFFLIMPALRSRGNGWYDVEMLFSPGATGGAAASLLLMGILIGYPSPLRGAARESVTMEVSGSALWINGLPIVLIPLVSTWRLEFEPSERKAFLVSRFHMRGKLGRTRVPLPDEQFDAAARLHGVQV